MPECVVCGAYTKYNNGKCTTCYNKSNKDIDVFLDDLLDEGGLSDNEWERRYNMIKEGLLKH